MPAPSRLVLPLASALLALILVLALVLGAFSKSSSDDTGTGGASQVHGLQGAVLPTAVRAPDFTLTNQSGRAVSLRSYRGKLVVLVFLDSSCRACVLVAQQVRDALEEAASRGPQKAVSGARATPTDGSRDALPGEQTIFVSTDPGVDTRTSVDRFLSETSLSGRVQYLTGSLAELRPVWRAYHLPPSAGEREETTSTRRPPATGGVAIASVQPASAVLLIDPSGTERVEFGTEDLTPETLEHDIQKLQTR